MSLAPMSFKDYVWPYNPQSVKIERGRDMAEFKIPQGTGTVQDAGFAPRKVSGSGRFTGSGGADEFSRLSAAFSSDGSGTLNLPGMAPFQAAFSSLVMKGEAKPDCVGYEFVFLEDVSAVSGSSSKAAQTYVCTGSETLWDIANKYGVSVDGLLVQNPQIEWPNALAAGAKVVIG